MNKAMTVITGILYGAAISIIPVVLINHRHLDLFFSSLRAPTAVFFVVCLISGIFLLMRDQREKKRKDSKNKSLLLWGMTYLFFYTACAALCQKLNLTIIDMNSNLYLGTGFSILAGIGLILVLLAVIILIRKASFPPLYWSWLLFMTGVPFIFNVWLPLLAIPGAYFISQWTGAGQRSVSEAFIN